MNYELIKATNKDIDILIKYKLASILDYAFNIDDEEKNKIINYVKSNIPKQIDDYRLICVDKKIVGCLLLTSKDDGILLDEIYLEEEYRRLGIGSNIIKNIMNQENIIYLWVYKENKKAFNLYQRLGFKKIEETDSRFYMKYGG